MCALTGETGAGKSILIDAIQMALGERASAHVVREGAQRAEVALEFDSNRTIDVWLEEAGFEPNECLLIRRSVDREGRSRAWINATVATAAQLRELANYLVDIHGQHAWAMLTRADAVRDLLDAYAQIDLSPLRLAWHQWRTCLDQLEQARSQQRSQQTDQERLQWQIAEVEKLGLDPDNPHEWDELSAEHSKLAHAQTLIDAAHTAISHLDGGDSDSRSHAAAHLHSASQALQAQSHLEPDFIGLIETLATASAQVADAAHSLHSYLQKIDLDPARLAQLDHRMAQWLALARRFKSTPQALPTQLGDWQKALSQLQALHDVEALTHQERLAYTALEDLARLVSQQRHRAAPQLALSVTQAMQELGIKGGVFDIALHASEQPSAYGFESAEFLVAGHAGSAPKPVGKVASGGELSRLALAIAVTTSELGSAPTLIFDEVDAGIGGATAQTVGRLMQQLGQDRQVLAVTHLPQVACYADHHGVVKKAVKPMPSEPAVSSFDSSVNSGVEMVSGSARQREIARMLGGDPITPAALEHAQEMLALAHACPV